MILVDMVYKAVSNRGQKIRTGLRLRVLTKFGEGVMQGTVLVWTTWVP
jgi:hypothetical protein